MSGPRPARPVWERSACAPGPASPSSPSSFCAACGARSPRRGYRLRDETPGYNTVNLAERYRPPLSRVVDAQGESRLALMGTDNLGRDVFSRLIQGARIAFHVGIVTSVIAVPFGALLGLLAGYYGGKVDALCTWLAATVAAIPALLLILAVSVVVGKGLMGVYAGISVTTWVGVYRTVRGETVKHRGLGYVQAAKALGYAARIMFRHICRTSHSRHRGGFRCVPVRRRHRGLHGIPGHRRPERTLLGRDDRQRPRPPLAGHLVGGGVRDARALRARAQLHQLGDALRGPPRSDCAAAKILTAKNSACVSSGSW